MSLLVFHAEAPHYCADVAVHCWFAAMMLCRLGQACHNAASRLMPVYHCRDAVPRCRSAQLLSCKLSQVVGLPSGTAPLHVTIELLNPQIAA